MRVSAFVLAGDGDKKSKTLASVASQVSVLVALDYQILDFREDNGKKSPQSTDPSSKRKVSPNIARKVSFLTQWP